MLDLFCADLIEFYSKSENVKALEDYRKACENAGKGGDNDDGTGNMDDNDALQNLPA